jgi:hypothetical protein
MSTTIKIVDTGLAIITGLVTKVTSLEPKYVGWGIGTTAASGSQTTLVSGSAEARTSGTLTRELTVVANDTVKNVATITCAAAPKAITEVGIFDAATDGNMFLRAAFDVVNVGVGDSIQFSTSVSFASA